MVTYWRRCLFY